MEKIRRSYDTLMNPDVGDYKEIVIKEDGRSRTIESVHLDDEKLRWTEVRVIPGFQETRGTFDWKVKVRKDGTIKLPSHILREMLIDGETMIRLWQSKHGHTIHFEMHKDYDVVDWHYLCIKCDVRLTPDNSEHMREFVFYCKDCAQNKQIVDRLKTGWDVV